MSVGEKLGREKAHFFSVMLVLWLLFLAGCEAPAGNINNSTNHRLAQKVATVFVPQPTCNLQTSTADLSELINQTYWRALVDKVKRDNSFIYSTPTELVLAIIQQETRGRNNAQSSSMLGGASGAMQIGNFWWIIWSKKPPTWLTIKLETQGHKRRADGKFEAGVISQYLSSPEGQVTAGLYLLDEALARWQGSVYAALADYNGGIYTGGFWSKWSQYAYAHGKNPLDTNDAYYRQLKTETIESFAKFLKRKGYEDNHDIAKTKMEETEAYVRLITIHLGARNCYLPKEQRIRKEEINMTRHYSTYTIHRGDTLTSIAKKYGTNIATLAALNPQITNVDYIQAGQTIKIPQKYSP